MQTIVDPERGNCFAACIASILDLPLSEVPNFAVAADWWWFSFVTWAAERGYRVCSTTEPENEMRLPPHGTYLLLGGQSPRFPKGILHSVVATRTWERAKPWRLVHDPHPSGDGILGEPTDAQWFVGHADFEGPWGWDARRMSGATPLWSDYGDRCAACRARDHAKCGGWLEEKAWNAGIGISIRCKCACQSNRS